MKVVRIIPIIFLAVIISITMSIAVFASSTASATVSSSGKVARGDSISFSVKINNGNGIQGIAIIPSYDKSVFELVGGEWVITGGLMPDFNVANGDGVIAFSPAVDINSVVLSFRLKAKSDAPMGFQTVSAEVIVTDNSGNSNLTVTASNVDIQCKHNYSTLDRTYLKSAASCSSPAIYYKVCLTCGEHATQTFTYGNKLPHTPGPEATETTAQKCTVCGDIIAPALGHTHNYSSEISSDANKHWYECLGCGDKKDEVEHVFENNCDKDCNICFRERETTHTFNTELRYDDDAHWQECELCGKKANKTSHNWDNGTLTTEATYSYSGIKTYCCTSCDAEKIELTPVKSSSDHSAENDDKTSSPSDNNANLTITFIAIVEGVCIIALVIVVVISKKKLGGTVEALRSSDIDNDRSDAETDSD